MLMEEVSMEGHVLNLWKGNDADLDMLTELLREAQDLKLILTFGPQGEGAEEDADRVDERLTKLFTCFGIRPKLKGYQYLRTAIRLGLENEEEMDGITKRLYPSVAKQHRTSADRVEHAIRHAIEVSWEKGKMKTQQEVFGYDREEGRRPTNSEFIMQVMEYLKRGARYS